MGFEQLIDKVEQAEKALETSERTTSADWRQFKRSWQDAWTPGRIVVAGLASGFIVGRMQPLKSASGSGVLNLMSALSGLFASGSAQAAAGEASVAAHDAERTTQGVGEGQSQSLPRHSVSPMAAAVGAADSDATHSADASAVRAHAAMRRSGLL